MNDLKEYSFDGQGVRIINDEGEMWFCAPDVCRALGYANTSQTLADHCAPKGISKRYTPTSGGNQELTYIDERNLYRLILRSKLPSAERFQEWVCGIVLPSIRKTGQYRAELRQLPQNFAEALRQLADEVEKNATLLEQNKRLEIQAEENAPKIQLAEKAISTDDAFLVRVVAKALNYGVMDLYRWLREKRLITARNEPYAETVSRGLFKPRLSTYTDSYGVSRSSITAYITAKGVMYILERLQKEGKIPPTTTIDPKTLKNPEK